MILEEFENLAYHPLDGVCEVDELRANITIAGNTIIKSYFSDDERPFVVASDRRDDGPL